jgi:peroxiredoxin
MLTIGDTAPDFSGNDVITGTPFTLSDHSGKVILLAFISWG